MNRIPLFPVFVFAVSLATFFAGRASSVKSEPAMVALAVVGQTEGGDNRGDLEPKQSGERVAGQVVLRARLKSFADGPALALPLCHELENWSPAEFSAFAAGEGELARLCELRMRNDWGNDSFRKTVLGAVAERWTQVDSSSALAWMDASIGSENKTTKVLAQELAKASYQSVFARIESLVAVKSPLIAPALEGFAMSHPERARAWFQSLPESEFREDCRVKLIQGLAVSAPDDAVALVTAEDPKANARSLRAILAAADERGTASLWRLGELMPDKSFREDIIRKTLEQAPEDACRMIREWGIRSSSRSAALNAWAVRSPERALAFCQEISPKGWIKDASGIFKGWAVRAPLSAIAWIEAAQLPVDSSDALFSDITSAWVATDPRAAFAWLDANGSPGINRGAAKAIATQLSAMGRHDDAANGILALEPDKMHEVAMPILSGNTKADFQTRAALGMKISERTGEVAAVQTALSGWAAESPEKALDWVRTAAEIKDRDSVMLSWVTVNEGATFEEYRGWVHEISDPWKRARTADWVMKQHASTFPHAARRWLESLEGLHPGYRAYLMEIHK